MRCALLLFAILLAAPALATIYPSKCAFDSGITCIDFFISDDKHIVMSIKNDAGFELLELDFSSTNGECEPEKYYLEVSEQMNVRCPLGSQRHNNFESNIAVNAVSEETGVEHSYSGIAMHRVPIQSTIPPFLFLLFSLGSILLIPFLVFRYMTYHWFFKVIIVFLCYFVWLAFYIIIGGPLVY